MKCYAVFHWARKVVIPIWEIRDSQVSHGMPIEGRSECKQILRTSYYILGP